ncbi:hypothetical protein K458DRAFT_50432 [Lentithecium fluviatile CBS 122367]|uniref:Tachykinin family protein n=1 Tax=Lentithecium fluviatile CBS 122367 TaxID=1168545 RepID=A0A6G1IY98_9PLEO|nr:hypothetical protein K458DRAFT_50432 [Lentithecium fluviatile CBS 122367]
MASPNETKTTKRRVGRKRLPPLPQGAPIQFVVASHPDDFRADKTMRHVRSHVMYKHRGEQRGASPRARSKSGERSDLAAATTRTPSPLTTSPEGVYQSSEFLAPPGPSSTIWEGDFYQYISQSPSIDPVRNLAARIIAATATEPSRSAPPSFDASEYPFPPTADGSRQDSLEDLKIQYVGNTDLFCSQDTVWMETVCNNRMSFLSHVSVACVYKDVAEGFLDDTALTVYAKTKVLRMITDNLSTQTDDFTILSILHLLVSEIGGQNEDVFDVHQDGLVRIVNQRGGIANLGLQGNIATFLIVVILSFTILRGQSEPAMLHGFVPSRRSSGLSIYPRPISPLYAPHGDLSPLHGTCSDGAYQIISDMHDLTHTFVARWNYTGEFLPTSSDSQLASYDGHMQQIYTRILVSRSTEDSVAPDWIYECCRLAALIYCRSIVQGVPLSESANVLHARSSSVDASDTNLISALHNALEHTDRREYWGDMCGVLLWVCLVGGAASWPSSYYLYEATPDVQASAAWNRKCFALFAVSSSLSYGFEHASATVEAQRMMLHVQHLINLKRGMSPH